MKPTNPLVSPLLTDLYQLTMAYAYWKSGRQDEPAVFDLFFRKNPFGGEFTVFAGLSEVLNFVSSFEFTKDDLDYVRKILHCEEEFLWWLREANCSKVNIYAVREGTLVFPHIPLIRVEGPLGIVQLLETTLLNLVNYPSLIATNAARFRLAAGFDKDLIEFGLRRAQGPDGGISASRYSYMGGFNGTSNVLAGKIFNILVRGTHAHSWVQSFTSLKDIKNPMIKDQVGTEHNFVELVLKYREELGYTDTNEGELAAFISYAQAYPKGFLALVDTYDTLKSGVPNFICVSLALFELGYKPVGIRLDSGDLAYLSKQTRETFKAVGQRYQIADFGSRTILASNDIDEEVIHSLNLQGHTINAFGIGTHLVTCKAQPALGCVYKLVEINGQPRIKLSEDTAKMTIPGRKTAYRLIGRDGYALIDLMTMADEEPPVAYKKVLCRHPHVETKRVLVEPRTVVPLHYCFWNQGDMEQPSPTLESIRSYVLKQLTALRPDHLRFLNPTPYKVAVSEKLYEFIHNLWEKEAPIGQLS